MDETLDTAGYDVHQLGCAVSAIEARAQSEEGREALAAEAEQLIEIQRRLYSLMWALSLVIKNAA